MALRPTDPNLWAARVELLHQAEARLQEALMVLDQAAGPKAAGDRAALRNSARQNAFWPGWGEGPRPARS